MKFVEISAAKICFAVKDMFYIIYLNLFQTTWLYFGLCVCSRWGWPIVAILQCFSTKKITLVREEFSQSTANRLGQWLWRSSPNQNIKLPKVLTAKVKDFCLCGMFYYIQPKAVAKKNISFLLKLTVFLSKNIIELKIMIEFKNYS